MLKGYGRKGGILILDLCPDTPDEKMPFNTWKGKKLLGLLAEGGLTNDRPIFYGWLTPNYVADLRSLWANSSWRNVPSTSFERLRRAAWEEIVEIKPKAVLCVGLECFRALTDRFYSVSDAFGYVIKSEFCGVPIIPLKAISKFYEDGQGPEEYYYQCAARKAVRLLGGEKPVRTEYVVAPDVPTVSTLGRFVDFMDACKKAPAISVDIEKYKNEPHEMTCIGLAPTDESGLAVSGASIPFVFKGGSYWTKPESELILWRKLAEVLATPNKKIFQNHIFDVLFLSNLGFAIEGEIEDTLLTEALLEPHPKRSLKELGRRYLLCEPWKEGHDWTGRTNAMELWRYNIDDAVRTAEIAMYQRRLIESKNLEEAYDIRIRQMITPVYKVCAQGMPFSIQAQKDFRVKAAEELAPIQAFLIESAAPYLEPKVEYKLRKGKFDPNATYCVGHNKRNTKTPSYDDYEVVHIYTEGDALICNGEEAEKKLGNFSFDVFEQITHDREFNPSSPSQVLQVLETMGIKVPMVKSGKKNWKQGTNTNALLRISVEQPNEFTPELLKSRELSKLNSSYLTMKTEPDGVMRFALNIMGAYPRLSSSKTAWDTGGNAQNPPKNFRPCFVAPEGFSVVQVDLSTAEARVVAQVAQDEKLLHSITSGIDMHVETANFLYDMDITKQPGYDKDKSKERAMGKLANFSLMYGLSARSFCEHALKKGGITLTLEESQRIVDKFFMLRFKLKEWHAEVEQIVRRTKRLVDPFGYPFQFRGNIDNAVIRKAFSYVPQSTVVNVTNRAWLEFEKHQLTYARVINQIHDALLFICETDKLEEFFKVVDESFGSVYYRIHGIEYQIPWDSQFGPSWGELKDWK